MPFFLIYREQQYLKIRVAKSYFQKEVNFQEKRFFDQKEFKKLTQIFKYFRYVEINHTDIFLRRIYFSIYFIAYQSIGSEIRSINII